MESSSIMILTEDDMLKNYSTYTYEESQEKSIFIENSVKSIKLRRFAWIYILAGLIIFPYTFGGIGFLGEICLIVYFYIERHMNRKQAEQNAQEQIQTEIYNRRINLIEKHNNIVYELHKKGFCLTHRAFDPSLRYCIGIDQSSKKFFIQQEEVYKILNNEDLIEFSLVDDQKIEKSKELNLIKYVVDGSTLFKGDKTATAIHATEEREEAYCKSMYIDIILKNCDVFNIKIPFIENTVNRESEVFAYYQKTAMQMISILKLIKNG